MDNKSLLLAGSFCLLATSHRTEPESVAAGAGGGFGAGRRGEPDRYGFTARSYHLVSPCYSDSLQYSQQNIYLGSNFIANLEVVSSLNTLNLGSVSYWYYTTTSLEKYNPRVYVGTTQVIASGWNRDYQQGINYPSIWPQNNTQKGEAIIN